MIFIRFQQNPKKGTVRMIMRGHANTAPKGQDLICGAATMLAYTLAQALTSLEKADRLLRKPKTRIREGHATIIATPTEKGLPQVMHTFWVIQQGCRVLAANYPEHVRVEFLTM